MAEAVVAAAAGGGGRGNPLVLLLVLFGIGWLLMGPSSERSNPPATPRAADPSPERASPPPVDSVPGAPSGGLIAPAAAAPDLDENLRGLLRGVGSLAVKVRTHGEAAAHVDATQFSREIESRLGARQRLGGSGAPGELTIDFSSAASEREAGVDIVFVRVRFARRAMLVRGYARPIAMVSPWTRSVVGAVERASAGGALRATATDLVTTFLGLHDAANADYAGPMLADDVRPAVSTQESLGGLPAVRVMAGAAPEAASLLSPEDMSQRVAAALEGATVPLSSTASAAAGVTIQAHPRGAGLISLVDMTVTDVVTFAPMPDAPGEPVTGVAEIWRASRLVYDESPTADEAGELVSELAREFATDYRMGNPTGLRETIIVR